MNDWTEVVTFGDLVVRGAERWPDTDAVVIDADRRTYAALAANACAVARSLHGLGVSRGDHVGLLVPNCIAGVEVMFGAALLGAVVVPINVRFKARELGHVIADGDLRVLVTSDLVADHLDFVALLHETLPGLAGADDPRHLDLAEAPELRAVVLLGGSSAAGFLGGNDFAAAGTDVDRSVIEEVRRRAALRDPAIMIYTSGTTAMPKGAPLSHEALVRTAVEAGRTRFRFVPGDRFWDPLPMFHMSFILPLVGVLDAGGTFISMVHFEPAAALAQLAGEGVTAMFPTFPAVTQALLNHPDYRPETLANVRITNNVAPPDTLRAMQAAMPHAVQISAYGLTECGGVVSFNDPDDTYEQRMTTQGRPFAGIEVCAKDPDDTTITLPAGERGELCVRGYNLFEGYYKDPERTASAFDEEGWFHTGDLGNVDADGRISYQGRLKDMLKVGGENVAAIEIESYLATHPAVSIAQVVGVPDEKYIEVAAAFLELEPGASVTEEEIIAFCSGAMASFKVPHYVRVVTEWPMSATKVQKFRLRDQLVEELSEGARTDARASASERAATKGLRGPGTQLTVSDSYTTLLPWGDLIVRGAALHPDRDAFVFPEVRRTYAEMVARATDVARALLALGVRKGDHVGILMPNCIDFLDVWFGISFVGAVCVPINARFKARELSYVIENGDLVAIFTSDIVEQHTDYVALLHEALPGLADAADPTSLAIPTAPRLGTAVLLGAKRAPGFLDRAGFERFAAATPPEAVAAIRRRVAIRDVAVIFYTSGTTAMPKGCLLDHETLVRVGINTRWRMKLTDGERMWDPLPLFHTAATQPLVAVLDACGTYLTMTRFEPAAALELIQRERVTSMFTAFPIIAQALLNHEGGPAALADVRMTFNVAPPDALEAMQARMPSTVQVTGFGMTETGGSVVLTRPEDPLDVRCGAEGPPYPGMELEIRDLDDNTALPPGERGEIVVRGPQVFRGYLKAPEKNAEVLEPAGWFHTGDLGALDDDGCLHYLGRAKDMLKVGGENVAAIEIESYLATHPAVSIAQVVGVPDDKYVEVAAAFVQLKPGCSVTEAEMIAYCTGAMASFKVPRYVRVVTEWPMSATKVQKFRLRDQLVAELSASS